LRFDERNVEAIDSIHPEEIAMNNEGWKRFRFGLTALSAAFLVACAAEQGSEGVTDDNIRVGMIVDLTGPLAFIGQEINAGAELYFQHVNEQGGVHGRKIELIVEDDGYQPPRTVAAYRKLVDVDGVFCLLGNIGTANTVAIMPMLDDEGIPLLGPNSFSSALYTPAHRYVFTIPVSYPAQSWLMAQRIAESPDAAEARLGVVYQDDDFGLDGLQGLREAAAHYGLTIVAEEAYQRGATDFSSIVLNLRRADPTHVILWTILRETAAVLQEAHELGWKPQFFGNNTAADDRLVGLAAEALTDENALFVTNWDPSNPKMNTYLELLRTQAPDREPGYYHAAGFTEAHVLVEGLERAGRDLNREKLVEAEETFDGWDDNAFGMPFTYGPGLRGGLDIKMFFARPDVEQGKMVRVTDDIFFQIPQS
jgi:branched-chain amino acid transport system substrate-binding protein